MQNSVWVIIEFTKKVKSSVGAGVLLGYFCDFLSLAIPLERRKKVCVLGDRFVLILTNSFGWYCYEQHMLFLLPSYRSKRNKTDW